MLHENPTLIHEWPRKTLQEVPQNIDGVTKEERPFTPSPIFKDESHKFLIFLEPIGKESIMIPSSPLSSTMGDILKFKEHIT